MDGWILDKDHGYLSTWFIRTYVMRVNKVIILLQSVQDIDQRNIAVLWTIFVPAVLVCRPNHVL